MLASGLAITNRGGSEYFQETFRADLAGVAEAAADFPGRLSVASFCPHWPGGPYYRLPAERFAELSDQRWFLTSLFVSQLASQASHSVHQPYYYGAPVVLVGLLSSYDSIVHPAFLLLALALYREAIDDSMTGLGLRSVLQAQIAALQNSLPDSWQSVLMAMKAGLGQGQLPRHLGPFVGDGYRYEPDRTAFDRWIGALVEDLRAAAT